MAASKLVTNVDDLDESNLTQILRHSFQDPTLIVTQVFDQETFTGTNDQLNSDIKKLTLKFRRSCSDKNDDEDEEKVLNMVVKSMKTTSFHGKISKFAKPFMKETFWYKYALPEMTKLYPDLAGMSPQCYYGYSNYETRMIPSFCRKNCCLLCWYPVEPQETGFMLLENVCEKSTLQQWVESRA
jgi:hypothetical protein